MKNDAARDKAIEKLLAAKLRAQAAAQRPGATRGENCLDSETLAAYVERSLAPRERLGCEAHLATCARCQDEVAELVRLSEADQPAVARPVAARAPTALGVRWFRWAWAAPALTAVVVAGLFWYSREPRGFRPTSAPGSEAVAMKAPASTQPAPPSSVPSAPPAVAENKPVLPAPARPAALREANEMSKAASGTAPAASAAVAKSVAIPANGRVADNLVRLESAAPPSAPTATPAGAPLGGTASGLIATPSQRAGLAPGVAGGIAGAPSSAFKEAEAAAAPPPAPAPPAVAVSAQAVTVETDSAAKAKKQEPVDQKLARQKLASEKSTRSDRSLTLEAFSSYGSGNWRVGARGLIEKPGPDHSWVAVPSGVSADLNAIAFPTPSVGWVVGQSGTVLRSTDGGATWQKISFPTGDDLARVSAASDQAARVATSGGKVFATADGGKSWKTP